MTIARCLTFTATPAPARLLILARLGPRGTSANLPIRWQSNGTAIAERILRSAVAATDRLRSFQIAERLNGGFGGPLAIAQYRIAGRYDFAINGRSAGAFNEIGLGRRVWTRQPDGSWQLQIGPPQDTRELMPWWTHGSNVRLLDIHTSDGRHLADLALAGIPKPSVSVPFWFRLRIDLASMRVVAMRMITVGHFMDQRYFAFNAPVRIRPPITGR